MLEEQWVWKGNKLDTITYKAGDNVYSHFLRYPSTRCQISIPTKDDCFYSGFGKIIRTDFVKNNYIEFQRSPLDGNDMSASLSWIRCSYIFPVYFGKDMFCDTVETILLNNQRTTVLQHMRSIPYTYGAFARLRSLSPRDWSLVRSNWK